MPDEKNQIEDIEYATLWQRNDLFVEASDNGLKVWRGGRDWATFDKLCLSWNESIWLVGCVDLAASDWLAAQ